MPPKRRITEYAESSSTPERRHAPHISRACDNCRKRKMKCDGLAPRCTVCHERDVPCSYKDEDRRKSNLDQMNDLRSRVNHIETMLETLVQATTHLSPRSITASNVPQPAASSSLPAVPAVSSLCRSTNDAREATPPLPPVQPSRPSAPRSIDVQLDSQSLSPGTTRDGVAPEYEQFQRVEEADGSFVQVGPTSIWTSYKASRVPPVTSPASHDVLPGDWVDWSRNLPSSLNIDRPTHDCAMRYFAAFYAPWCLSVDMPHFLSDLPVCNIIRGSIHVGATRTAHYSPLLHCSILFLGLYMIKDEFPEEMTRYQSVFWDHCTPLLLAECTHTGLGSLKAYNVFANCAHFLRGTHNEPGKDRQCATGYLLSGLSIAGVHVLGLNINCEGYVRNGRITHRERNLREYAYWSIHIMDTIRSLAAGRQPILPDALNVPFPQIDNSMDRSPWMAPRSSIMSLSTTNGYDSMRSTAFHWMARLAVLNRSVLGALYLPNTRNLRNMDVVPDLSRRHDEWFKDFPLNPPEAYPLPHILLLHAFYHLSVIFVHRPFYRSSLLASTQKCDQAALSILSLLHLFERTHGVRFAHHNLINAIFGAATVFLLRCVGTAAENNPEIINFDECVTFMGRLAATWHEAEIGREILLSLRTEYFPGTGLTIGTETAALASVDQIIDFQEWLESQDFSFMTFPEAVPQWGGIGTM